MSNTPTIIIGIDPDSEAHGVAMFKVDGICKLQCLTLVELFEIIKFNSDEVFEAHMENVCGNNATFQKRGIHNQRATTNVSRSLGKCQQSQIELERVFKHLGVKVVLHPISKNWKAASIGKKALEKYTGWTGRSNEDTRSAAYFGWLGCKVNKWHTINHQK